MIAMNRDDCLVVVEIATPRRRIIAVTDRDVCLGMIGNHLLTK